MTWRLKQNVAISRSFKRVYEISFGEVYYAAGQSWRGGGVFLGV